MSEIQQSIFDYIRQPFKIDKPIRLISLFSGYDSQAMALKRLGVNFEHYRAVEFDKYAMASLNAIHGTNFEPTDIKDVKGVDLGIVDKERFTYLLTYSFPCQSLSLAGKQEGMAKGSGTRSGLLWEVERILKECKELNALPDILQMENVTEVHGYKNKAHFDDWCRFLEGLGYTNYLQDLNAADYGTAQHRERSIMVSLLGNYNFKFPEPIELRRTMADYLEDEVDEKYYIKSQKAYDLIVKLVDEGTIPADNALNERTNERTGIDSALTEQSMNRESGKSLTASRLDTMQVSAIRDQMELSLSNKVGFIDKGSGEHQSNQVFSKQGICPTVPSVSYKEPLKILE